MTGMREDLERHRHHKVQRPTSHWMKGDKAVLHPGPVDGCALCLTEPDPKEES